MEFKNHHANDMIMKLGSSEDAEPFIVHVCQLGKLCGASFSAIAGRTFCSFKDANHRGTLGPSGDPATKLQFP